MVVWYRHMFIARHIVLMTGGLSPMAAVAVGGRGVGGETRELDANQAKMRGTTASCEWKDRN